MLILKTNKTQVKDYKKIKSFIKHLNKEVKVEKDCSLLLYNEHGFDIFDMENKECQTPGYYESNPSIIHACCKGYKLKFILETIAHEYMHFMQENEYGINLSSMANSAKAYFTLEIRADKFMRKVVKGFFKNG